MMQQRIGWKRKGVPMEWMESKTWRAIVIGYWIAVFCAAGFFYWLIFSTLL